MIVGAVRETFPGERRVALTPAVVPLLVQAGYEVRIEAGAGTASGFADEAYAEKGARPVADRAEVLRTADVLLQVRGLGANPEHGRADLEHLRRGQVLLAMFDPLTAGQALREVAERGVTLFAMELVPRIARAQSMDVLSSMASIAGYKAVLLAANQLPKLFPMMMTAAGTIAPAKVFVIGAGVAGLQAIATARRLGALVSAYDVRPAVREQVQSLGAKFVELEVAAEDAQAAGGYARQQSDEFYRRQREAMARVVAEHDVVIATAAVPGARAPILVTAAMVGGMRAGSVIVDLAAERGGNCELTEPGRTVVHNGVTILGPTNLPADLPYNASQMYARNLVTMLRHLTREGRVQIDLDDEITRETLTCRDGEITQSRVREALGLTGAPTGAGARSEH
jgi:NAD(P) transhydrogenase subunit alpha